MHMISSCLSILQPEWLSAPWNELESILPTNKVIYLRFLLPPSLEMLAFLSTFLTDNERVRSLRYLRKEDRDISIASRGTLRYLLGLVSGLDGRAIDFSISPLGKPSADGESYPNFSVSHCKSMLMIGLNPNGRIGVDVEQISVSSSEFLLDTMSNRELEKESNLLDSERLIFRYLLWTRKEAVLKATGVGLHQSPTTCDVLESTTSSGLVLESFVLTQNLVASFADEGVTDRIFISVD